MSEILLITGMNHVEIVDITKQNLDVEKEPVSEPVSSGKLLWTDLSDYARSITGFDSLITKDGNFIIIKQPDFPFDSDTYQIHRHKGPADVENIVDGFEFEVIGACPIVGYDLKAGYVRMPKELKVKRKDNVPEYVETMHRPFYGKDADISKIMPQYIEHMRSQTPQTHAKALCADKKQFGKVSYDESTGLFSVQRPILYIAGIEARVSTEEEEMRMLIKRVEIAGIQNQPKQIIMPYTEK